MFKRNILYWRSLVIGCLLILSPIIFVNSANAANSENAESISIGVLAYKGKAQTLLQWMPMAKYLSDKIPAYHFRIVPLTLEEINQAINKDQLNFVLTNPGHYIQLQVKNGATRIVTFEARYMDHILTHFGTVIFTRKNEHLNSIASLKGHSIAAVGEGAFGGFQLAQKVFIDHKIDINKDLNVKWLGFPQADIVRHVLSGKADAGIVRTGILEKMAKKNGISLSQFNIIAQKKSHEIPFVHSSSLYPEWPFSTLPKTQTGLAKKVAIALLDMPQNSIPALASEGAGWTIPSDYEPVREVLKELHIAPYALSEFDLDVFWQLYHYWIVMVLFIFLVSVLVILFVLKTNRKLLQAKQEIVNQRDQLAVTIQQRTAELMDSNKSLQQDIESRIQSEKTINDGCEFLQALYNLSTRLDLTGKQKLQSILDLTRQYLGVESATLSRFNQQAFNLCIYSSSKEMNAALCSVAYGKQAVAENRVVIYNGVEHWQIYIALPVFISDHSGCLFEFVTEKQDHKNGIEHEVLSEFDLRILNILAFWASNEIIRIDNEDSDQNQRVILQQQFLELTSRELEVLKLVVDGEPNKSIARLLNISPKTVELHRANLLRKTDSSSTIQLVKQAVLSGIVTPT
jgi:ABC-type phosphate/phosphonate transport system substrate-binding protein/DNA-binding CsgD family transcriptional regulator